MTKKEVQKHFAELVRHAGNVYNIRNFKLYLIEDDPKEYPKARDFAKTDGVYVYVPPKFFKQSFYRIDGLLKHEIAHAVLMALGYPEHSEREADECAEDCFGTTIFYDSEDVQNTRFGKAPRPEYLPK